MEFKLDNEERKREEGVVRYRERNLISGLEILMIVKNCYSRELSKIIESIGGFD